MIFTKLFPNRQISGAKNFKAAKFTLYCVCYGPSKALSLYLIVSRNSNLNLVLDHVDVCIHTGFTFSVKPDPDC